MDYDYSYLDFIVKYHPKFYSDDRVLVCDILFRYIFDEDVDNEDFAWLKNYTRSEAMQELIRLETLLFSESLQCYYGRLVHE